MIRITDKLTYLTRTDWGADTSIPRLGHPVNRLDRTEAIHHHTVIVDSDVTKNRWETLDEVKYWMKRLQKIRPDLGLDVPYNFVMFLMADGTIVVCEGRGFDRTGAHTYAHNTRGMATALQGNFQLSINLTPYLPIVSRWWGYQKYDMGMENLGTTKPLNGSVFGHLDFTSTSCPGSNLYSQLPKLTFAKGGLTMGQYEELKGRIKRQENEHDANKRYRRSAGDMVGRSANLLMRTTKSAAKNNLDNIIAAAKKMKAELDNGKIVP